MSDGRRPSGRFVIPADRLPPGFARSVDEPPAEPVAPRPAATAVLARDAERGPEVLLLRRHRSSGFVPGAWVFPGGRVDDADADAALVARADGLDATPAAAFWFAAAREIFEETGVLLARGAAGGWLDGGGSRAREWRARLLDEGATLLEMLTALDARLDLRRVVPFAHWITPVVEPRRYDTHFFLAELPPGSDVEADEREMTGALWIRPAEALERFAASTLPMVFPTVHTLQELAAFDAVAAALDAHRGRVVRPILPRLVRREGGVAIEIGGDAAADSGGDGTPEPGGR